MGGVKTSCNRVLSEVHSHCLAIVCGLLLPRDYTRIFAADARLSWNANSEPELAGYKVHYGTSFRTYGTSIDVGKKTTYTVTGLTAGTYYFAVTAVDTAGNETGFSNEVTKTVTGGADTTPLVLSSIQATNITRNGTTVTSDSNQSVTEKLSFKTTEEPGKSATPSSDATFISQVIESNDFRTNLGVNNLSNSTANVSVTLVDVDGMELATKTMQVEPQGLTQLNAIAPYLYEENLGNEIRGSLYLESDQPISAWASQIENSTNDPSLLLSKRSGATQILIPSAANTGAFTSSLVLMNVGVNTGNVAIKAYGVDGTVLGQTATPLSVPANGTLSFDNILETLGVKDNYGPLEITSLDNVPLVAASRVSSTSKAGGFFEGISYSDASQVQFIPHVVDTAELRTNIGINNVSDTLASVTVRLMSPQGSELGALPVMVMPRGMTQLNQIVRQLLNREEVTNVEGYVRLESSQPILGWASQIDNTTHDPGFAVSKGGGASKLLVQSTANVGNFKSSLAVVNLGEAAAAVDIVAHNVQGTVQGELRGQVIPPRGFISVANLLEGLGTVNDFGPVEIVSTNGQPLLAASRVYSLSHTSGFFEARVLE